MQFLLVAFMVIAYSMAAPAPKPTTIVLAAPAGISTYSSHPVAASWPLALYHSAEFVPTADIINPSWSLGYRTALGNVHILVTNGQHFCSNFSFFPAGYPYVW